MKVRHIHATVHRCVTDPVLAAEERVYVGTDLLSKASLCRRDMDMYDFKISDHLDHIFQDTIIETRFDSFCDVKAVFPSCTPPVQHRSEEPHSCSMFRLSPHAPHPLAGFALMIVKF